MKNNVETVIPEPDDLFVQLRLLEYFIFCAQSCPLKPYICVRLTAKPMKMRKIFAPT